MRRVSRALPDGAPVSVPFARALAAGGLAIEGIDRRAEAARIFASLGMPEDAAPPTSSTPPARSPPRA